jgi:hypothetical protein
MFVLDQSSDSSVRNHGRLEVRNTSQLLDIGLAVRADCVGPSVIGACRWGLVGGVTLSIRGVGCHL